ncbi:MAG: glutamate-5-semialdehyde dehydrogenase [Christensenellales bacterium]|jgi:glutamate-5-semialdehyde dehydrogenase
MTTHEILTRAREAKRIGMTNDMRNAALHAMADQLLARKGEILAANARDVEAAQGKLSDAMIDRLRLDDARIEGMARGVRDVAALESPVGKIEREVARPNGLVIEKRRVPFGVVAIIYESRPNVTSDAAALAIQSGNVCVLRVGREAFFSAAAIVDALREGLMRAGANPDYINLITDTSRESANELMRASGYVDLLIPRGGAGLIRAVVENATVPVIETGTGICHVYVDEAADLAMAAAIVDNAKTSRPSVCNAAEVLLVHTGVAEEFLPKIKARMPGVELRLCPRAARVIGGVPATDEDFDTEFLDHTMAVKIVDSLEDAIAHIASHSTGHSDAIVTGDARAAERFTAEVDSAAVYVNASTRFTDGGEFGLGCEMGISTQKLHARGPMGLEELTTYKYVICGDGQVR